MPTGRIFDLDENGYTITFLCFSTFVSWDNVKTCRIYDSNLEKKRNVNKSRYVLVISPKTIKKKDTMSMSDYCLLHNSYKTMYVYFMPIENVDIAKLDYVGDGKKILNFLKRCQMKVENVDMFKDTAYDDPDNLLQLSTKLHNEYHKEDNEINLSYPRNGTRLFIREIMKIIIRVIFTIIITEIVYPQGFFVNRYFRWEDIFVFGYVFSRILWKCAMLEGIWANLNSHLIIQKEKTYLWYGEKYIDYTVVDTKKITVTCLPKKYNDLFYHRNCVGIAMVDVKETPTDRPEIVPKFIANITHKSNKSTYLYLINGIPKKECQININDFFSKMNELGVEVRNEEIFDKYMILNNSSPTHK